MNIEERISKLSKKQRALFLGRLNLGNNIEEILKIACFYVSKGSKDLLNPVEKLALEIPSYMIPNEFVRVDQVPRLPNGKIDNEKLLLIKSKDKIIDINHLPSNDIETLLLKIWKEVLDNNNVGTHDNFFEVGGDSISSIRIISKAKNEGLNISPNQLFEYQTISLLAKKVYFEIETKKEVSKKYYGEVKLTPIQLWFFDKFINQPNHWNQGYKFNFNQSISSEILIEIVIGLIKDYDSLSYTFQFKDGVQSAKLMKFSHTDYCHTVPKKNFQNEILEIQKAIDLQKGPLFRFILIDEVDACCKSIALIAHHLIIDAISWSLLIDRLNREVDLRIGGHASPNFVQENIFKNWIDLLYSDRIDKYLENEEEYWIGETSAFSQIFPSNTHLERDIVTRLFVMDEASTSKLINDALEPYNLKVQEIILTAYVLSVFQFHKVESIAIWIEHHGRNLSEEDNFSELLGWFTSYYPLRLSNQNSLKKSVTNVKDNLRSVPSHGIGFGYLKYIKLMQQLKCPEEFAFNYLGTKSKITSNVIESVEFLEDGIRSSRSEIVNGIELNCWLTSSKLENSFRFNSKYYNSEFQDKFLALFETNIKNVLEHCLHADKQFTPSDFPDANLSEDDLKTLFD